MHLYKHVCRYLICFVLTVLPPLQTQAQNIDENQTTFESAIFALNSGDYTLAITILRDLYIKTNSPRVKLEWARACYLSGNLSEADELFREVLNLEPPMMVREKIGVFLEEISLSRGKIEAAVGLVMDTNPLAVTNNRVINLYGQSFQYDPGINTSPQYGAGYTLVGAKALGDDKNLLVGFSINGAKFEDYIFDRTSIQEFVSYRLSNTPQIKVKASYEQFFYGGNLLYTAPALSFINSKEFSNSSVLITEIKTSNLDYPTYTYLSGPLNSFTTSYAYPVLSNANLALEFGLDRALTEQPAYSYKTQNVGIIGSVFFTDIFLKMQLKISATNREFDDFDPIFGVIRVDKKRGAYLNLVKTDWKIFGVAPSVDIGYEINNSNIDIFTYDRMILGLNFKKVY